MENKENIHDIDKELINNRYELVEWVGKKAVAIANAQVNRERNEMALYKKKLKEKYEIVAEDIRKIQGYANNLHAYEKNLEAKEKALSDRNNNLQLIYDKMIQIEKRLNSGEWPRFLPPLNLEF